MKELRMSSEVGILGVSLYVLGFGLGYEDSPQALCFTDLRSRGQSPGLRSPWRGSSLVYVLYMLKTRICIVDDRCLEGYVHSVFPI